MANTYIFNMTDLWSNASQQFASIKMNVTDTASLANSHLIRLQIGSSDRFTVDKTGNIVSSSLFANGTVFAPNVNSNNSISVSNSTVLVAVNTSLLAFGNTTTANAVLSTNTLTFSNSTSTAVVNTSGASIGNTTTANVVLSTTNLRISNSTSVSVVNASTVALGNGTANSVLSTSSLSIANSTASIQIVNPANLNITSNTGFNLGTSTKAANGSTYLPNGLLLNWGTVAANTTAGLATFTTAYTTAVYCVQLTGRENVANISFVLAANTTTANVRSTSTAAAGSNVYYLAIGV